MGGPAARRGGIDLVGARRGTVWSGPYRDRAPPSLAARASRSAGRRSRERGRCGHSGPAPRARTAAPLGTRRPVERRERGAVARKSGARDARPQRTGGGSPASQFLDGTGSRPRSRPACCPSRGGRVGGAAPAHDAQRIVAALRQVVLGQEAATREVLVCLLARRHILLQGVPGTAKTLLVRTLALALDVRFVRIQFTPDLMPADITGITLLTGTHEFSFRPGPVFADLILADEINRAPAKTQAALLEAMQERTVTVDGKSHPLSATFTVFATQNPIEFEGTYPLPEAELDRFMIKALFGYPPADIQQGILTRHVEGFEADRPATYGVCPVTDSAGGTPPSATAANGRAAPEQAADASADA